MTLPLFDRTERASADGPDAETEQRALIALSLVPGVGPGRVRSLLAAFGSATAVMRAAPSRLGQVSSVGPQTAQAIRAFDDEDSIEAQVEAAGKVGAKMMMPLGEGFPHLLKNIYDPPAFLWRRGALTDADSRSIAIVGTRKCTDYGRRQAELFADELARQGFTIVSGLAYGVDAAAHQAALKTGGRTVAVLGSGVDRIYPAKHTRLAESILEGQGAVLSEYPMGAKPDAPNFPRRNRIISGLSLGTLVVESFEKGGALITARMAVEQGREVFALPNMTTNAAGVGANRLIQRGHAKLVLTVDDILEELPAYMQPPTAEEDASADEIPDAPLEDLNAVEQRLLEALDSEPTHIDALCAEADLDPSSALVYLLSLEFKGLVRQMAGKQFYRV